MVVEFLVSVGLEPEHFYRDHHQTVFWAILFLHLTGNDVGGTYDPVPWSGSQDARG